MTRCHSCFDFHVLILVSLADEDVKEQTMQQKPRRPTLTSNATTRIGTEVILALVLLSCNLSFLIQALPLTFF